jgi:hypothetical protein
MSPSSREIATQVVPPCKKKHLCPCMKETGANIIGEYRYRLWRIWDETLPRLAFIMLNPSTATAEQDDPTVQRCLSFACQWGYGSLTIVNLFAFRTSHPRLLTRVTDPIGPENDVYLRSVLPTADTVVAAWGTLGSFQHRDQQALKLCPGPVWCLGTTREGFPRHPLYLRRDTTLRQLHNEVQQ